MIHVHRQCILLGLTAFKLSGVCLHLTQALNVTCHNSCKGANCGGEQMFRTFIHPTMPASPLRCWVSYCDAVRCNAAHVLFILLDIQQTFQNCRTNCCISAKGNRLHLLGTFHWQRRWDLRSIHAIRTSEQSPQPAQTGGRSWSQLFAMQQTHTASRC
jgi:hypothetical protein